MSRYPESTSPRLHHDPDELSRRCTTILTSRTPTAEQMARVQAILGESSRFHTIPEGVLHDPMAPRQANQPQPQPLPLRAPPSPPQVPYNQRPRRMADQGLPLARPQPYDRYDSDSEEQHRPKRQRTEREYTPDRRYEDAVTLRADINPGRSRDGLSHSRDPRRDSPDFTNADRSTSRSSITSHHLQPDRPAPVRPDPVRPDPIRNDPRDRAGNRSHQDDETFDDSVEFGRGTAARRPSSVQSERFGHGRNLSLGPSGFGDDEPLQAIGVGFELDGRSDSHRDARRDLKTGTGGDVGDKVGVDAGAGASSRAGAGAASSTGVGKKPEVSSMFTKTDWLRNC